MKTLILSVFTFLAAIAQPVSTTSPADMQEFRPAAGLAAASPVFSSSLATSARWEAGASSIWRANEENVLFAKVQSGTPETSASPAFPADADADGATSSSDSAIGPANNAEAVPIEPSPKVARPATGAYPGSAGSIEYGLIERTRRPREKGVFSGNKIWTASAATHIATTLSDGLTSYYLIDVWRLGTENNRIINAFNGGNKATFGAGGFAYKAIWFSAINVPAYFLLKKYGHNNRKLQTLFSILNFESSALFTRETLRNAHYMSVLPH